MNDGIKDLMLPVQTFFLSLKDQWSCCQFEDGVLTRSWLDAWLHGGVNNGGYTGIPGNPMGGRGRGATDLLCYVKDDNDNDSDNDKFTMTMTMTILFSSHVTQTEGIEENQIIQCI